MSIETAFPGIEVSVVYPLCFLLCHRPSDIFPACTALMLSFQASFSQMFCAFLRIDAKRKKGWGMGDGGWNYYDTQMLLHKY